MLFGPLKIRPYQCQNIVLYVKNDCLSVTPSYGKKKLICKSCLTKVEQSRKDEGQAAIERQRRFWGLPSWALALIVALFTLIFSIFLASLLGSLFKNQENITQIGVYILWAILVAVACLFICKNNPSSIWYVPILCNAGSIISAIVEPNFWSTSMWILICGGWILSLVAAVGGAIAGKRAL